MKLAKAGCKLGKVKGHESKGAKVRKKSAESGRILPLGSRVGVTLK
jgi:hypothetical protein